MQKHNLSQAYDVSSRSSLTKFNLTKYKTKSNQLKKHTSESFNTKNHSQIQPTIFNKTKTHKNSKPLKHLIQNSPFQTFNFDPLIKKRKKFRKPLMQVEITSRSQKQLIEFMNPQSLPKIQLKNRMKQSSIEKIMKVMKDQKKLKKFTQNYFQSLEKANKSLKKQKASQQFPQIKVLGWSVIGYRVNENIILKAVRFQRQKNSIEKRKIEKFKKISQNQENRKKVLQNYEQFVKEWLYLNQVLSK